MTDIDDFDDTSTFENKAGLAEDMRFLASIPEGKLCLYYLWVVKNLNVIKSYKS